MGRRNDVSVSYKPLKKERPKEGRVPSFVQGNDLPEKTKAGPNHLPRVRKRVVPMQKNTKLYKTLPTLWT